MKKVLLFFLFVGLFSLVACSNDDDTTTGETTPDYHVHIMSPNTDNKHVGDSIHIHVEFEDHNGGTVHHVNVNIRNKETGEEIYTSPTDAHVHAESGKHELHDDVVLDVTGHSNWLFEAKVWGHDAGAHEASDTLSFHVHP